MAEGEVFPLTPEGKEELERELDMLVTEKRPSLAVKLKEAVSMGDLKENADYHDTREQMALLDGRVQHIDHILKHSVLIEKSGSDFVGLGATVTIREVGTKDDEKYKIVGVAEANPGEGRISEKSPIGAALLKRKVKDQVNVETPSGRMTFEIRKIE